MSGWNRWWVQVALRCVGAFLLLNILLIYVPTSLTWLAGAVLLAGACLLVDPGKILPMTISLLLATAVLEVVVRSATVPALVPYYRPHEMLALETNYKAQQRVEMTVKSGDLLTIDTTLPATLAQPRQEVFITDSHGYRNDDDYKGEKLVVIGDSFLVGTETTLASVIEKEHHVPAYNVAFSGMGPLIYTEKVQWARKQMGGDCCLVLFYFEGNDFQHVDAREAGVRESVPRGLQNFVKGYVKTLRSHSEWSKSFSGMTARAIEASRAKWGGPAEGSAPAAPKDPEEKSFVRNVGGKPMVFLRGYAEVTRRKVFDDHSFVRNQLAMAKPDMVVFIPDKYRVYAPLLDEKPEADLPTAQWTYLSAAATELGVPAIDLTPHMIARSREMLAQGGVTFWRDDTHWNRNGEKVAADVVLAALHASSDARCVAAVKSQTEKPQAEKP